ncbi:hypothetical protein X737_14180 [Mesorhizobium sp. L48C026A00]|nr:hypothetical protein X737_14180 [Mesorhizobium sp. L48C026A00]
MELFTLKSAKKPDKSTGDRSRISRGPPVLARPDAYRCTECGLPYRTAGFCHHRGKIEDGAAYWSDRGILCSPQCSLAHHRKRQAEGTLPQAPAPDPFHPLALR